MLVFDRQVRDESRLHTNPDSDGTTWIPEGLRKLVNLMIWAQSPGVKEHSRTNYSWIFVFVMWTAFDEGCSLMLL